MLIWFCLRKIFTTALLFLAFIAPVSVASADDYPDTYLSDIYLTTEDRNGVPMRHAQDTFQCSDKIYGVVKGRWVTGSEHLLEAYWADPRSKQREHTQYKFNAGEGETRTWVWLLLHRAEPDILDRLMMQENDSLREFNGQWKVDFYVDGNKMRQLTFNVTCE